MSIVVAKASSTVFIDGQRVHIIEGTAWAAESVAVKLHPDSFSADPKDALGLDLVPPRRDAPVEQKTAAPGEKAHVKRRNG